MAYNTKHIKNKKKIQKAKKKKKYNLRRVDVDFIYASFFHKFTFVVLCSVLGICTLVQGLDTYMYLYLPPYRSYTFPLPVYVILFMLPARRELRHFKRPVLVFSIHTHTVAHSKL